MRIALIARSTLFRVHGGSTVQVRETAAQLRKLGVDATVHLSDDKIDYPSFDLLHFFDITRPANILYHIRHSKKPFVLSPILIDYSEYDQHHRKGFTGRMFRLFSPAFNEYVKTVSRWILGRDRLPSKNYLLKGQTRSIRYILDRVAMLLPNSQKEYEDLASGFGCNKPFAIVPNGIDSDLFQPGESTPKDENLVLCAARIEGLKNQVNLIRALNNTSFRLLLAGAASSNQQGYYRHCRKIASGNVEFKGQLTHHQLIGEYRKAKVHILPSWFETCGLSSLEAAAMGCNIVISDKGYAREYFGDDAIYCDPASVESIYESVVKAASLPAPQQLQEKIVNQFTWHKAAVHTLDAYQRVLGRAHN